MQNLWHACLRRLEQELPAQQFNTWIRPLAVDASEPLADTLALTAPNRFILELVRERFAGRITQLASEANGRDIQVRLLLARAVEAPARGPAPVAPRAAEQAAAPDRARLNRKFAFDTFVTGKANQLARAA